MKRKRMPACLAALAALVLALAACAPYEPPFVWEDGFVRYAHVGYAEAASGEKELALALCSEEELEAFCALFPREALGQDYDELPSFAESVSDLGSEFFAENVLLVAYFPNESGSCRLRLRDLSAGEGDTLVLSVERALPAAATDDVVGRAVLIGVSRAFYAGREISLRVLPAAA